jgi:hypothetical protein
MMNGLSASILSCVLNDSRTLEDNPYPPLLTTRMLVR